MMPLLRRVPAMVNKGNSTTWFEKKSTFVARHALQHLAANGFSIFKEIHNW